jgi:hypothetical protein
VSAPPGTDAVAFVDERLGAAPALRRALRYVFPEQWSFLLGEIALYSFVVLLGTGVFLAPYAPLAGTQVTKAYDSTLGLSFEVPGGLLMRQVHHWAALVFLVAIVMHLLRVFFTGAFRRPRRLTWAIGVTLMAMAVLEGFAGYSLPDDLLSGMGLAIANGVALSLPIIGGDVGSAVWGGQFPGSGVIESRLYVLHILVLPLAMAGLIAAHLALIIRTHHTQSRGPGRRESNVVGAPLWPTYAVRSLGLLFATAAVLVLLGGLIQVNPVWEWGALRDRAVDQRRAARLVPGVVDRRAAADAAGGARDRRHHAGAEPVLGRRALPGRRVRLVVRLPVDRERADPRPPRAPPDRPAARPPVAHGVRGGAVHLGGADLHRRLGRPAVPPARLVLRGAGPRLPRAGAAGPADRLLAGQAGL